MRTKKTVCVAVAGCAGSGKSTLAKWVCASFSNDDNVRISWKRGVDIWRTDADFESGGGGFLVGGSGGKGVDGVEEEEEEEGESEYGRSLSVIVLDDFDVMLVGSHPSSSSSDALSQRSNEEEDQDDENENESSAVSDWHRIRQLQLFARELDRFERHRGGARGTLILLLVRSLSSLDGPLRSSFRIHSEFTLKIPSFADRVAILAHLFENLRFSSSSGEEGEEMAEKVARVTPNFVPGDLVRLKQIAVLHAQEKEKEQQRSSTKISWSDLSSALQTICPVAVVNLMSLSTHSHRDSSVLWEHVGGYESVKKRLLDPLHSSLSSSSQRTRLGLAKRAGLLLYGPSGCGKSMLIKAVSSLKQLNFIEVTGSDLFSMYTGETESAIRDLFQTAKQYSPCVIVFDELDALAPKRGETDSIADSGSSRRALSQLLTEIDGIEDRGDVFVIGCTNRKDLIDPALLRPGRFDQSVLVSLPTVADRREILLKVMETKGMPVEAEVKGEFLEEIVELTDGWSGADLESLCREAGYAGLRENMSIEVIGSRHFREALRRLQSLK